ncbi:MAG: N-acetylmuramoyl-L-alanine amidase [Clostridiales bacterium]|nr:N-acetylmuramoyl-L-alanine amidase [Clostridiales bacterium]
MEEKTPYTPDKEIHTTGSPKEQKKGSSFLKRILLFCSVALLLAGGLLGGLYYLDRSGRLDRIRDRFQSSPRSGKNGTGEYYYDSEKETTSAPQITTTKPSASDAEGSSAEEVTSSETTPEDPFDGDLSGYTIILDPGHGGKDSGCVFPFSNPQYNECDFNLRIALATKEELESRGATVYLTRPDNSWVSLYSRPAQAHLICMDIAKEMGILPFTPEREEELRASLQETIDINESSAASGGMGIMIGSGIGEDLLELVEMEYQLDKVLFLSIHLNSNEPRNLHGTQIYYVTDESVIESENRQKRENSEFKRSDFPLREDYYGRRNEDNELLAMCLYDNIVGNIPDFETNARPTVQDNFAVLREHGLVGALIEVAYLSDDNDREMLLRDDIVAEVAHSIGDGVKMYFTQKGF